MPRSSYTIESLRRSLCVLSVFDRENASLSLTELVELTGLNKTTTFRIVTTLEEEGYLDRDPRTKQYRPGLKVLQLGFTAISSLEFRQTARPHLRQLSKDVSETVSLSVLDNLDVIYVDRVRSTQLVGVVMGIGSRIPARCASMGKVMLAYLPADDLAKRLDQPSEPCTPNTVMDRSAFELELAQVREQGYALNNEELEVGLRAVAAPLWDSHAEVVAAINISGMVQTISYERMVTELAPKVVETAGKISRALGYQP